MSGTTWHKMAQNWGFYDVFVPLICNTFNNSVQNYVQNFAHREILEQVVQFLSGEVCGILWQFVARKIQLKCKSAKIATCHAVLPFIKINQKEGKEFIKNIYARARGCAICSKTNTCSDAHEQQKLT